MNKPPDDKDSLSLIGLFLTGILSYSIWHYIKPSVLNMYFSYRSLILLMISVILVLGLNFIWKKVKRRSAKNKFEKEITNGKNGDSVYAGIDVDRKPIHVNLSFRRMHAQVVGTTNAGKTESVIVPWAIDDIEKGRGLILIDGKADKVLLDKLYAYAKENNRTKDFRIFSLSDYSISHTFNPLIHESIDQTTEKIINSFGIENEYYRTVQFDIFRNILSIFKDAEEDPTFLKIRQVLTDPTKLSALADKGESQLLKEWAVDFLNKSKESRSEQVSGLLSNLGYFTSGEVGSLFNTKHPSINIQQIMDEGLIAFFQLPVLKSPMLGKAVAKMVLQDIQSCVSVRHASGKDSHPFMGVYLDDFTEYLTKSFVSVLNKSRSANVGITFAHQAVGDLEGLGMDVKNQIQTNTNLKVFMRTNEPASAEYFSRTIGTKLTQKTTKRQKQAAFGIEVTNDGSIRDAEEFIVHPNVFKKDLGLGEGIMILTHERGAKAVRIKFGTRKNLKRVTIPEYYKPEPELLDIKAKHNSSNESNKKESESLQSLVSQAAAFNNNSKKEVKI